MIGLLLRWLVCALGLYLATLLVPGIEIDGLRTLLFAAALLGFVNAAVRPLVVLLTLPFTILTLGLFLLVINASMLGLVAALLGDFSISGFFSALAGSLIISFTSAVVSWNIGPRGRVEILVVERR